MNERKNQLIELEQSASEFVENLKRLAHEIDGYQNAKNRLDETKNALLPLISKVTDTLSAVNLVQSDVSKLTSNELLAQISALETSLGDVTTQLSESTTDLKTEQKFLNDQLEKVQSNLENVCGLIIKQINNSESANNEKHINTQRYLEEVSKQIISLANTITTESAVYQESLTKQNMKIDEIIKKHKKLEIYNWLIIGAIVIGTIIILIN